MEASGQLNDPAAVLLRMETRWSLKERVYGPQNWSGYFGEREKFLTLA